MQKVLRIGGIIAVVVVLVAAIIASTNHKASNAELVWNQEMTVGNLEAKNYFIIYSDLVCPYCVAFENAIIEHREDFERYLEENDVLVEIRLSDFLYEYGESNPKSSRLSAEAVYCAKREGKFWDYYDHAITTVWQDYFKEGGKAAFTALNKLDASYWKGLGHEVGLAESFDICVDKHEALEEIESNAARTARLVGGMPYFKFNSYTSSGFDLSWGWEYVLMYFQAGLESK